MARKPTTPKAPTGEKRPKKPRRPAAELLEIAKSKVERFARLKSTWELKIAKLEVQAVKSVSDETVRLALGDASPADIEAETLALTKRLAILNRGAKLVNGTPVEPAVEPAVETPAFLTPVAVS